MAKKNATTGRNRRPKRRMGKGLPTKRAAVDEPRPREGQTRSARCGRRIGMAVATRRQTAQEQRRFEAALELLLTELVRQEIARGRTVT